MIGLLQRVDEARVEVAGEMIGSIARGLVVLIGIQRHDGEHEGARLIERIMNYRVFPDAAGKMNRSVGAIGGGVLLVPQFTLAADTHKGTRPSFTPAAAPAIGRALFDALLATARRDYSHIASGRFGADMKLSLVNDGPVTFWLEVKPRF